MVYTNTYMKRVTLYATLIIFLIEYIQLVSTGQEAKHTLSDFKLGDHISGEKRKLSKLDGKVVVIEWWGTR